MKKTKREGIQSPEPCSSSSSSSQYVGATLSQGHTQPEWEGPLDFTKPSGVKEEDHEEVLYTSSAWTWLIMLYQSHMLMLVNTAWLYFSPGGIYSSVIHFIWRWGRGAGQPGGQEVPRWGYHLHLQGQVSAQRQQKRGSCVSHNFCHQSIQNCYSELCTL